MRESSDGRGGTEAQRAPGRLLLTGATGFVGGELLPSLIERSEVRCLVRDASRLPESDSYASVVGDLTDIDSLRPALEAVEEVYYLVHSMEPGGTGFAERDRAAAENFAEAAGEAEVRRVIYLGGIFPEGAQSEHLESRQEVEDILAGAVEEFVAVKASMIVGAKSASFRTLAQLVDRLPVLAMPSWRERSSQPVAIADVVGALVAARDARPGSYDVAGPDTLTFEEMTKVVAELLGKEHRSLPLPFSDHRLEARTAAAVVDADVELLEPLMAGLHSNLVVEDNALPSVFGVEPTPFREAARLALEAMETGEAA